MRAVIQRVIRGCVRVDGQVIGQIDRPGAVVLVGVERNDGPEQIVRMVRKISQLRIFDDETSLVERAGPVLVISQFTLCADTRKGRRPSWSGAAAAQVAEPIFVQVVAGLRECGLEVATGQFGAMMEVELVNDGPFTLIVEA